MTSASLFERAAGVAGADGRPLRVLFLSRSYPNNIFETLGLWTERPARQLGTLCSVRVVSPVPYCPPLPAVGRMRDYTRFRDVERDETRHGIRVYRPRYLVGPASRGSALEARSCHAAVRRLVGRVRSEFAFDLIHAHSIYPEGVVAERLSQQFGVPFVVTEHAPWHPWFERRVIRSQALPAARQAAALTAVSRWLRSTIHRYLPDAEVQVIPNGVDPEEFPLGTAGARVPKQITFVGFPNFNKAVDVLLEAMRTVIDREPDARLILVGEALYRGAQMEQDALKRLARKLGFGERVLFAGRRPPAEVARVMRESAVVVLPSKAETFGSVLIEALASGTPVVSTRSGGPEDIVTDDVGRLVPRDDSGALAEALVEVLRHPEAFPPERLRERAISRYAWPAIASSYHSLYREVLGTDHSDNRREDEPTARIAVS
jgi:teichuronic acid biosynthesis glycosyltransferase TuaC